MAKDHSGSFYFVRNQRRLSNFSSPNFSRSHSESYRNSEGSKCDPSYPRGDTRSYFEGCSRANRRLPVFMSIPDLRDPQEIRGSTSHSESQRVQSFSFNSTFQDGNSECYSSTAVSKRLGCFNRSQRCLPPHSDSSGFQEVSRFSVSGIVLPVRGSSLRAQRLPLGFHQSRGYPRSPSPSSRSPDVLLPGRLAPGSGVQGTPGIASSDCASVDPRLGFPCELGEVSSDPPETSFLPRSSVRYSEFVGSSFGTQDSVASDCDSGSLEQTVGDRPPLAEISRPSRQLRGLSSPLQIVDEASSTSSSAVLHSLGRPSGQTCSSVSGNQGVVQSLVFTSSSSRGKAVCSPSTFFGSHHRCVQRGVGGGSSSTSGIRSVVEDRVLGSYKCFGDEGGSPSITESRVSGVGSFGLDSFRQHDSGVLHQSSGRDSFLIPVSTGLGPVGVVSAKENFPSSSSHSRRRESRGGFPFQGQVPPFRVVSKSCCLSEDLPDLFPSSGGGLVRLGSQLPAPEVLLSVPRCSGLEDRRVVVSVEGSSSLRFSSLLSSPQDPEQDCSGRSGPSSSSPVLASEALVPLPSTSSGGLSKVSSVPERPSCSTSVSVSSSQCRESSSFSMASLRKQGEEAGLSCRAAQFTAESLRESSRRTYDSRLDAYRTWCDRIPCDPISAPLGVVADFLLSLFDKGLAIATLRSYRSAIASCHRGFTDGSSVTNSHHLTRLLRSFFLKRPPSKTLLPAWSLPAVLQVLAAAPFEPLHNASLGGYRFGPQGKFATGPLRRSRSSALGACRGSVNP